jgi:hypothetical protein
MPRHTSLIVVIIVTPICISKRKLVFVRESETENIKRPSERRIARTLAHDLERTVKT